jgi:hypothetical protein
MKAKNTPEHFRPKEYETRLKESPSDLNARLMLMAHYESDCSEDSDRGDAYLRHLLWMINNRPEHERLRQRRQFIYNDERFRQVKRAWLRVIRLKPNNVKVLENAAASCTHAAPKLTEKLLQQAKALEPSNEDWAMKLSQFYFLRACDLNPRTAKASARKCIAECKQALELHDKYPRHSYLEQYMKMTLTEMSRLALLFGLHEESDYFLDCLAKVEVFRDRRK